MASVNMQSREMFVRSVAFFIYGVGLASLFIWCIMQGIMLHLQGNGAGAFPFYFLGWVSGIGGLALYWQAKELFHFAEISK
ncbi:MAG TPA: hypothetical protein HA254_03735 [Candidatus Diapherotrites archaeon]|uniref:Uncharacterized protein n=1 Tax=Candidatus Iainarchaeum sp. TaxID=3101447 RepID=A0A7J4J3E1_9ARCH|nr:hypothetical protein [Candidatus Diapherotrites archaeon]